MKSEVKPAWANELIKEVTGLKTQIKTNCGKLDKMQKSMGRVEKRLGSLETTQKKILKKVSSKHGF